MLKVRDVMTTDVITVTPETTVREALEVLGRRHVSGVPVVAGTKLVGVVSGTDLMNFAAALPGVPTEREIPDESGLLAEPALEDVEQEREPASAFFTELWDDAGADVLERVATTEGPEWNALEEHDVSEVMTRAPLATLPHNADLQEAADLMQAQHIHRVLITDGDQLVGIVSALDVAKAAAAGKLTRRTYAFNRDDDFKDAR